MISKYNHLVTKEILEKYYNEEVIEWIVVEHDVYFREIGDDSFISVILKNGQDILPLKSYLRFLKLSKIL